MQSSNEQASELSIGAQLYKVLSLSKDIEVQVFSSILEILSKSGKNQDCLKVLLSNETHKNFGKQGSINIQKVTHILKAIKENEFSKTNYSTEIYREIRIKLIKKISNIIQILECLKFFVRLTAFDETFIQCGSNSLNLLVEMKADLNYQFWENIRIRNTTLFGANFAKCILSGSEFENVDINGINLNGAILFNCKWSNIQVNESIKLNGHQKNIQSICFSPDGKILATCGEDYMIKFWDVKTGKAKKFLIQKKNFWSVCFSPNRATLASGDYGKFVKIFNFREGKIIKSFLNAEQGDYVCFSNDGYFLAFGDIYRINLWDVQIGQLIIHSNKKGFRCLSRNGTELESIQYDEKFVQLLDAKARVLKLQLDESEANLVCFSPNGQTLASTNKQGKITLWDINKGKPKIQIQGQQIDILAIFFSPDSTNVGCGSQKNSICLWDAQTGQLKSQFNASQWRRSSNCCSPDGNLSASYDQKSIYLQERKTINLQQVEHTCSFNSVEQICYSPDGKTLASCSKDKYIRFWEVKTGKLQLQLNQHSNDIYSICYSPDGTILASCGDSTYISLWDVKTGQLKKQFNGQMLFIYSVCFSPDGKLLASCGISRVINVWDARTGQLKFQLQGNKQCATPVYFSPDGATLASVSQNLTIYLWDVKTSSRRLQLLGHKNIILSICFSPDGTILASGSDKDILLQDVVTGKLKSELNVTSSVLSLCFSPDSTILASATYPDFCIQIWNVETGELKQILAVHSRRINSLSFSPDGTTLVSGSSDCSIRIWEIKSNTLFQTKYDDYLKAILKLYNLENISLDVNRIINKDAIAIATDIKLDPVFQVNYALIFQSSISNRYGMNLLTLFEQKRSIILEKLQK